MPQKDAWEREYKNTQLLTKGSAPRSGLKHYLKFLRKEEGVALTRLHVLDLGSGTGRNANYLAEMGNTVVGLEIAENAISLAKKRAAELGVAVSYQEKSIGESYDFGDDTIDLVLDVMTSNSLNEKERAVYLSEVVRVLRPGGHFFFRGLCKDGDKNTKNLLKESPGDEYDTYKNKDLGLTERVFSEGEFRKMYEAHFEIQKLFKKTNYARMNGRVYKRNYLLSYMKKA